MEYFEHQKPKYESVASLYINNPNKTSYLLLLANEKAKQYKDMSLEIFEYIQLMISLVTDYVRGSYRQIPYRTLLSLIGVLIYFVYPKKTFLDKVPGVKLLKELALIRALIKSLSIDLHHYALWKEDHEYHENHENHDKKIILE